MAGLEQFIFKITETPEKGASASAKRTERRNL